MADEETRGDAAAADDEAAEVVAELLERVCEALDVEGRVEVEFEDEELRATVEGDELGILIGRHGATIDALQHLARLAAVRSGAEGLRVVVDAAGYRERRAEALRRSADRAAAQALRYGRPVELEPMSASERRLVHQYLAERHDVETHSEGTEPDRRLVVSPLPSG